MHVHYTSDVHSEYNKTWPVIEPATDDALLVLAGDIGNIPSAAAALGEYLRRCGEAFSRVVYVPGNHEYWKWCTDFTDTEVDEASVDLCAEIGNVVFLKNDVYSRVSRGSGREVRVLGCVGWPVVEDGAANEAMSRLWDFKQIGVHPKEMARWGRSDTQWLLDTVDTTGAATHVVVTHYPPIREMMAPHRVLGELWSCHANRHDSTEPRLLDGRVHAWISGHTHYNYQASLCGTWLLSNPWGHADETSRRVHAAGRTLEVV